MRPPVGGRAVAVRNANEDTVFLFGYGVYVGSQPRPGSNPDEVGDEDRKVYAQWSVQSQLDRDLAAMVADTEEAAIKGKMIRVDADKQIAHLRAQYDIESALTVEQRIMVWHRRAISNPKIVLDSGAAVWGFQCWWQSEDAAENFIGDREVVIVPVPEGNPQGSP